MNGHNDNVCDGISDFTLSRYIEKKMVSGSVRLHLLMAEEASLPDDQNGDKHKDDPDYLPDLPCLRNGSHNGTLYVAMQWTQSSQVSEGRTRYGERTGGGASAGRPVGMHGEQQKLDTSAPPLEPCLMFLTKGVCTFGGRCRYSHDSQL